MTGDVAGKFADLPIEAIVTEIFEGRTLLELQSAFDDFWKSESFTVSVNFSGAFLLSIKGGGVLCSPKLLFGREK